MTTSELITAALEEYNLTLRAYGRLETGSQIDGILQYMSDYYDATAEQVKEIEKTLMHEHENNYYKWRAKHVHR